MKDETMTKKRLTDEEASRLAESNMKGHMTLTTDDTRRRSVTMQNHITLTDLAQRLGMRPGNLRARIKKDGVATKKAPLMTGAGLRVVRWVPLAYAEKLTKVYEEAKSNSKEGN